tara:strand:+ start:4006 stop:5106 length:1101 start_codon:yes stop_codon:yes gene_type:complete
MVIGFDAKRLFHNKSGLGAYSRSLVKFLVSHYPDNTYHLFTPPYKKNKSTEFFEKNDKVLIHIIPRPFWLWRSILLPFLTKGFELSVFHGLSGELPWVLFPRKVKSVVTIHDVIFESHPEFYSFWNRWIYKVKTIRSIKNADKIIAISRFTQSQVLEHFDSQKEIQIVSPPLNELYAAHKTRHLKESEFKALYNLRNGYFLHVGSIGGRKNTDVLLKAFANVPHKRKKKLVFISNESFDNVYATAKKYDVEDWIRVEKGVDDKTLSLYYSFCSVLVYPSIIEGFGLPILEGIAHGARVICSDTLAHREAGGEMPVYFDSSDYKELSTLLSSLSYHERKSEKAALSHLNTFNPSIICGELMRIYAQT